MVVNTPGRGKSQEVAVTSLASVSAHGDFVHSSNKEIMFDFAGSFKSNQIKSQLK